MNEFATGTINMRIIIKYSLRIKYCLNYFKNAYRLSCFAAENLDKNNLSLIKTRNISNNKRGFFKIAIRKILYTIYYKF